MTKTNSENDYYPYADSYDKVCAYKSAIIQSLDLAVHPEHLKRVYKKLDKLKEFWEKDMKLDSTSSTKEG